MLTRGWLGDAMVEGYSAFRSSVKDATGIELAMQTPQASVAAQLRTIDALKPSHNGLFLSHSRGEYRPPS